MKNHKISLALLSLLVVAPSLVYSKAVQADAVMVADKAPKKKCDKPQQKPAVKADHEKKGKGEMHQVERELDRIKADFKSGKMTMEEANAALDKMPAKIKRAIAKMKKQEEHGSMWRRHQHRMNEKLEEVRKFVNNKNVNRKK